MKNFVYFLSRKHFHLLRGKDFKMADQKEYKLLHVRPERKKGKKKHKSQSTTYSSGQSKGEASQPYQPRGHYNADQRAGKFSFDTIHGLKLKEVEYTVPPLAERKAKRAAFNGGRDKDGNLIGGGARAIFLQMLARDHEKELVEKLGLTERDLDGMRHGYTPNGFNVHHKLSLHGGGKNEISNFILTPLYPHDQFHHDVIDPQLIGIKEGETRKILIPWTDEMIYDPKQYGFFKENQPVRPNYVSNVDASKYSELYLPEHISVERRQKDMASFYAELDAKKAAKEAAKAAARTSKETQAQPSKQDKKSSKKEKDGKGKKRRPVSRIAGILNIRKRER